MTLASANNRDDYTGNGTTWNYAYTFRVYAKTDVNVYIVNTSTGVETLLVVDTDYRVNNIGASTGTIDLFDLGQAWIDGSSFLDNGYTLAIIRDLPFTQPTEFRNQGTFYPATHEDAIDRVAMLTQQLKETEDRTVKFSEATDIGSFDTSLPSSLVSSGAGKLIVVNDAGDGFDAGPTAGNIAAAEANAAAAAASAAAAEAAGYRFLPFASDAAFVTDKGSSATDGDAYYNSTTHIVKVYKNGAWVNMPHLSEDQTFTGVNTLDKEQVFKEIATPSNPSAGYQKIYVSSTDNKLKRLDSSGTETTIGSGSGGGLDTVNTQDFELDVATSATTGLNATFGTAGTFDGSLSNDTSTEIAGSQSLKYTASTASTNDWFEIETITCEDKEKGEYIGISVYADMTNFSQDVDFVVLTDEGTVLTTTGTDVFTGGATKGRYNFIVNVPSTTTSYTYGCHMVNAPVNTENFIMDECEIKLNPIQPTMTDWIAYTPTYVSMGTVSNNTMFYRRVGDTLEVFGSFTSGTTSAAVSSMSLPSGLSIDTAKMSKNNTTANSGDVIGGWASDTTAANSHSFLVSATGTDATKVYFAGLKSLAIDITAPTALTSTQVTGGGTSLGITFSVPILGWTTGQTNISTYSPRVLSSIHAKLASLHLEVKSASSAESWETIAYGNGKWVALAGVVGTFEIMTSTDGVNWSSAPSPYAVQWRGICYGNGLFVAVARTGTAAQRVMTSPDGITWTARTAATSNSWNEVVWDGYNGLFVAVGLTGDANDIMTSPDGITWTTRVNPVGSYEAWEGLAVSDLGKLVAVAWTGTTKRAMTSSDGITWTAVTTTANNWIDVAFGDGRFVAVAATGTDRVMYSDDDGATWTDVNVGAHAWQSIAYGNGVFTAISDDVTTNYTMTSTDGIVWSKTTNIEANYWNDIAFGDGQFTAVATSGTNRVQQTMKIE